MPTMALKWAAEAVRQSRRRRRRLRRLVAALSLASGLIIAAPLPSGAASGGYDPSGDPYSMANIDSQIGASAWWDAGYTGAGIDVAVIDTGVTPVPALSGPGKVVYGPDLSFDSQSPSLRNLDSYGHGTFMAGLIAGHDPSLTAPYSQAPASAYRGVAPDARIVSVKVGATDGQADVSQVIAAIDWVVQHAQDPGFNIRVINLSYGTNSRQRYQDDPLAYAAEQAWDVPGSFIDSQGSNGILDGQYMHGSGTSEATAITSGAIALILQRYPSLTPDQVKAFIQQDAQKIAGSDDQAQGKGELNLAAMLLDAPRGYQKPVLLPPAPPAPKPAKGAKGAPLTAPITTTAPVLQPTPPTPQGPTGDPGPSRHYPDSDGDWTLEGSRGSDHVSLNGKQLIGEIDIFGHPFNSAQIAQTEANGSSWSGGTWNGSTWSGSTWSGSTWSGSTWSGSTWSGSTWSGSTWSGSTWSGSTWSGSTWSGNTRSGSSWSGSSWS